jgi:signal-transduction protein with cAMP-binding, CBS, and nucleotidyltransferase domain
MEAGSHPEIRDLKRIRSLSEFSDEQLTSLSNKLEVQSARKNETVLEYGSSENYCLYLLAGKLEATTQDNRATLFEGSEDGELRPIAKIRPSMYQVVARGACQLSENMGGSTDRVCTTTGN